MKPTIGVGLVGLLYPAMNCGVNHILPHLG